MTQDSPGPGRSRAGGRGYEGWQPGRAPSARCTGKSAAGDERGGKFGSGGTRRSRAVRGDLRRGSPCRLPVCPRSPAAGSGTLPRVLRASPHSPDRRGRAGRVGEAPVRPALDPGFGSDGGTWTCAWAQLASVAGQSRLLVLPGLCDLGPVSSGLSLPSLRNGRLTRPRECCGRRLLLS